MKQCLLLFTFLCVAILPSFSQQKIDILGNAGKEQEIKLSEVAKSVRVPGWENPPPRRRG